MAQQVGRHQQIPANLLAVLLQPRRHVHGIAEIGKLAARAAAFADDHVTGMQAGAEARHHAELLPVAIGFARNRVGNREEAVHAASAQHPVIERPRHDDLIADIGMNLATMRDDRAVDVEKEAGEQTLHAQLAHRLGERGGACEIEKHQHARFPHRASVSAERHIEQHAAADQPCQFKD